MSKITFNGTTYNLSECITRTLTTGYKLSFYDKDAHHIKTLTIEKPSTVKTRKLYAKELGISENDFFFNEEKLTTQYAMPISFFEENAIVIYDAFDTNDTNENSNN